MENFVAYNPTSLHFGKDVLNDLGKNIDKYGKRVLLVYGKGSIKRNGIYNKVIEQLNSINAEVFEYGGIKSNPIVEDVDAAAEVGRKNNVEVVLAVGGGSVLDSAKIISIAIPVDKSAWGFYQNKIVPQKAIPIITVLTLAATGTEMNPFAVVQNNQTKQKLGYGHPLLFPKHSFLDPQNTFSVPKNYTAYGIVDLIAHCFEAYFGAGEAPLTDRFIIAIIQEALHNGPLLLDDLTNYDYRANIMYAATCALNKMTSHGKVSADWGAHSVSHIYSLLYDIPHGAALSITYPTWLELHKTRVPDKITHLGKELFNVSNVDDTIARFKDFFKSMDCPLKLSEMGIPFSEKQHIFEVMQFNKVGGYYHKLNENDCRKIIDWCL